MKKISTLIFLLNLLFVFPLDCFASGIDTISIVEIIRTKAQGTYISGTFQTKNFSFVKGILVGTGSTNPITHPVLNIDQSNDGIDWNILGGVNITGTPQDGNGVTSIINIDEVVKGKFIRVVVNPNSSTISGYNLYVYLSKASSLSRNTVGDTNAVTITSSVGNFLGIEPYRKYLSIVNVGGNDCYLGFNSDVGILGGKLGIRLVPTGSATGGLTNTWTSNFSGGIYTGRLWARTITGTTSLQISEHD
ncbi:MAG: hypothetical protein NUV47_00930 [Patescibacteria group bacterium]|nr:hypothetical protein [Patescibacteria group bacterium]